MATISSTSASGQSVFQQQESAFASKKADQAQKNAQNLRQQANAAQVTAESDTTTARTLEGQADQAQVKSQQAQEGLSLSKVFTAEGGRVQQVVEQATGQTTSATYSYQNSASSLVVSPEPSSSGGNVNTTA
jgi:hypothetical protein